MTQPPDPIQRYVAIPADGDTIRLMPVDWQAVGPDVFIRAADLPVSRLDPWHTLILGPTRWKLVHPIECNLEDCRFDDIADAWTMQPAPDGKYWWSAPEHGPDEWTRVDIDERPDHDPAA